MKVAILQWINPHNRNGALGTVERISTTGADCVDFFKIQMDALGYKTFVASEDGPISIEHPEWHRHQRFITFYDGLEKLVQLRLDEDVLGQIFIRGEVDFDGEVDYKWWRITFRNLH